MAFDAGSIQATLTLDRSPFSRDLDAARSEAADFARETYAASVGLDLSRLRTDIRDAEQQLQALGRDKSTPTVELSTLTFQRQLDTVRTQLDTLATTRVSIEVSLSGGAEVIAELTAIRDLAKEVGDLSPTVHVSADGVDTTLARLAEVAAAAAAIGDANVDVGTSGGGGDAGGGGGGGLGALAGGITLGLPPALGAISSALNAIPAAVATAVTAMAALKIGIQGVGDALKAANTPQELLAQKAALDALAPSARDTATAILNLGPAFQDLQTSVQGALFNGLADQLDRVNLLLPVLQSGLTSDASALNLVAREVLGVVTSSAGMADLNAIFAQTHDVLVQLAPAAAVFVNNLLNLGSQGAAFLQPLAQALDAAAVGFNKLIVQAEQSGALQTAFSNLAGTAKVLLDFFNQLVAAGIQIEAEIGGQVNATLAALGRVIIAALPSLTSLASGVLNLATGVGNALVPALNIVTPIISAIGNAFAALPGPIGAGVVALTAFSVISGRMGVALTGLKLEMALLPGIFTAASAAATRFGAAAGVAAVAAGGLKAIGSSLLTAFGGPWGLALAAGVAILALFGAQSSQAAQQQKELAQAGADVANAIAQQNGVIDENVRQTAAKKLSDEGILQLAQQLGINLGQVTDAAMGNADAYNAINQRLQGYINAGQQAIVFGGQNRDAITGQAHSAEDLRDKLAGVVGGLHDTLAAQNLQNQAVQQAKTAQDLYNQSLTAEVGIIQNSLGATLSYQSALLNVTSAHNSAVQAINQYGVSSLQAKQAINAEEQAVLAAAKAAQDKAIADAGGAKASGAQEAGAAAFKAALDRLTPTLSGPAKEALAGYISQLGTVGADQGTINSLTQTQIDKLVALAGNLNGPTKEAVTQAITHLQQLANSHLDANTKAQQEITTLQQLAAETTGPLHDAITNQIADLQKQAAQTVGTSTTVSDQIGVLQTLAGQLNGPEHDAVAGAILSLQSLSQAHIDARTKTQDQITILQGLADQMNGPARDAILALISNLKSIPPNTSFTVTANGVVNDPSAPGAIPTNVGPGATSGSTGGHSFATGGVLPGYTPGRDVHTFVSPTGGALHLSGGEAVMRPEWTAAVGAGYVNAANHAAATGGVSGVSRFVRGGDGAYAAGGVLQLDPNLYGTSWTDYKQTRAAEVKLLIAQEMAKIKALQAQLTAAYAGGGAGQWSGVASQVLGELGRGTGELGALLRRIDFESGGNPNAVNLSDSNAAAGHPSVGLMQVIAGTFASYAGPYRGTGPFMYGVSTDPHANIYAGANYAVARYGSIAAIDPNVMHSGYDTGGWLLPGLTAAMNATGKPEAVLTQDQWQAIRSMTEQAGGATEQVQQLIARLGEAATSGQSPPPGQLPAEVAEKLAQINQQIAQRLEEDNAKVIAALNQVAELLERRGAAATINVHDRSGDPAELARTTMLALRLS